jgi:HlyD family secretion protein
MKKFFAILIILALLIGGGVWWHVKSTTKKETTYTTAKITKGDIINSISSSGSLAALNTVEVGSQVSGKIVKIYVDFNDEVKENQLIAELDDSSFKAQVLQAKANLESAKAGMLGNYAQLKNLQASMITAKADIQASEANVKKAEINVKDAERNYKRIKELFDKKLIAKSELDNAETSRDTAKANLDVSKANLQSSRARIDAINAQIEGQNADLESQKARIAQTEAQLSLAQIDLDRTKIYSPINGRIISRDVDEGQTVAASFQAPKLFTIAQDLRKMQIDTAVDETDIGVVKEGQQVTFTVDAYKDKTFKGVVHQVRLSPNESSSVITYSVMVNVDNDELLLKPGMTANAEILVSEKKNVLRMPQKAMFVKTSDEMKAEIREVQKTITATDTVPIWVKEPRNPKPTIKLVKMGFSNQDYVEVANDALKDGDEVVIGVSGIQSASGSGRSMSVRMGGPRR